MIQSGSGGCYKFSFNPASLAVCPTHLLTSTRRAHLSSSHPRWTPGAKEVIPGLFLDSLGLLTTLALGYSVTAVKAGQPGPSWRRMSWGRPCSGILPGKEIPALPRMREGRRTMLRLFWGCFAFAFYETSPATAREPWYKHTIIGENPSIVANGCSSFCSRGRNWQPFSNHARISEIALKHISLTNQDNTCLGD